MRRLTRLLATGFAFGVPLALAGCGEGLSGSDNPGSDTTGAEDTTKPADTAEPEDSSEPEDTEAESDTDTDTDADTDTDTDTGEANTGDCNGAPICEDFESGMDSVWQIQNNSVPAPEIDGSKGANGSARSLKTVGTSTQSFIAVEVPAQAFYTRAYMNFEKKTQDMGGHGWFIVAADNVSQGDQTQIRFGASSNHGHPELDMNVYSAVCGGEKTQFSDGASDGGAGWNGSTTEPVNLDAGTWYCVEIYFDGAGNESQLWVDGTELTGLNVTEDSMCSGWSPTYTHIKFGAGANGNIGSIWYDDVAVSTTRIGCD